MNRKKRTKGSKKEFVMSVKDMPINITKLTIDDRMLVDALKLILADYNIYSLKDEQIRELFYALFGHMIKYLDTYPGHYFKLDFLDIFKDDKNLLCVKGSSDYDDGLIDADLIYNKFCSEQRKKEELENAIDIFAQSFIKKRERVYSKARSLSNLIKKKEELYGEAANITREIKGSKKFKQYYIKKRKENEKAVRIEANKKRKACYASNADLLLRKQYAEEYAQLELQLRRQWIQDKNKFPFEDLDN